MSKRKLQRLKHRLAKSLEKGNFERALVIYGDLEKLDPSEPRWPHKAGDLHRRLGQPNEAVEAFERAVHRYAEKGFLARAIAMAKVILTLDESRTDVLYLVDPEESRRLHRQQRDSERAAARASVAPRPARSSAPPGGASRPPSRSSAPPPRPSARPSRPPKSFGPPRPAHGTRSSVPMPRTRSRARPGAPASEPPAPAPASHPPSGPPGQAGSRPPVYPSSQPPAPTSVPPAYPSSQPPAPPSEPPVYPSSQPPARASEPSPVVDVPPAQRIPQFVPPDRRASISPLEATGEVPVFMRSFEQLAPAMDADVDELRFGDIDTINVRLSDLEVERRARMQADEELDALLAEAPPTEHGPEADEESRSGIDLEIDVAEPVRAPDDPVTVAGAAALSEDGLSAEELALLPGLPLFAELPREALRELGHRSELVGLDDGELVFEHGDKADSLYVIVVGEVHLRMGGDMTGAEPVVLGEGDIFGETCLISGLTRTADARVSEYLVALRVTRSVLRDLVRSHPRVGELLFEVLLRRVIGNLLTTADVFSGFDTDARKKLARRFEARSLATDSVLVEAGKRSDGLYILLMGRLEVDHPGGASSILAPIAVLGKRALIADVPAIATVRALTKARLLRLSRAAVQEIAESRPDVRDRLARLGEDMPSDIVDAEHLG